METPSPIDVHEWTQVVAFLGFLVVCVALPSVITLLSNRRVKGIEQTLTTNNGGSTIKDALDRIEGKLDDHGTRLAQLEQQKGRRGLFG